MTKKAFRENVQLTLDQARKPTGRGGWRPNAGRPKGRAKGRAKVSHDARAFVAARYPQHVTLRIVDGVPSLRQRKLFKLVQAAIRESQRQDFRIVHFSIETNHIHAIIETESGVARARGVKGLKVRVARRVNRVLGRKGKLFEDRYHARPLETPREVRNAIRYVLNNARHHAGEMNEHLADDWIDPCSSAAWFDGWAQPVVGDTWWKRELLESPAPTAAPRTWLLAVGWRRHGALRFNELPGRRS
jgi:REP element-mobilizing transposase RayT